MFFCGFFFFFRGSPPSYSCPSNLDGCREECLYNSDCAAHGFNFQFPFITLQKSLFVDTVSLVTDLFSRRFPSLLTLKSVWSEQCDGRIRIGYGVNSPMVAYVWSEQCDGSIRIGYGVNSAMASYVQDLV